MPGAEQPDNLPQILDGVGFDSFDGPVSRRQAIASARALVARLETPMETMVHLSHEIPALYSALKVAMDQDVFEELDRDNGSPKTPQQLARNADPNLLNRFLRHLAAMDIIGQAGPGLYSPTPKSSALRNPTINAAVTYFKDVTVEAFLSLPAFLEHTDFRNPDSASYSNWQYMLGRNESHFQWLAEHPAIERNFANLMAGYTSQRGSWLDVYPGKAILDGAEGNTTLVVDVGGGMGQDLTKFVKTYPQSEGRLVVQDLPQVVKAAEEAAPRGVKVEPHDFFTPEPIHGARAYFLHSVLHDWPDDKGREILANLKPAMKPGYSRLLVNELVIPSVNATPYTTAVDLTMAALFSARERSEDDWTAFLGSAGFRVVKFWQGLGAAEAVIEAEPA